MTGLSARGLAAEPVGTMLRGALAVRRANRSLREERGSLLLSSLEIAEAEDGLAAARGDDE